MRSHEEFCAELERRKEKLINAKKTRQRILLSCIPFVICFGLIAAAGMQGRLHPEINSNETTVTEMQNQTSFLKITLPTAQSGGNASFSEAELDIKNEEAAAILMSFLETNEEAFLFSSGDDGWYVYTKNSNVSRPEASETENTDHMSASVEIVATEDKPEWETVTEVEWETVTETEWIIETVESEEEMTDPTEGTAPSFPESTSPEKTCTETNSETDCQVESTATSSEKIELESPPSTDPLETDREESTMGYQFSSAELSQSVSDIDLVYIISFTNEEGKTVRYALDAVKYAELAEQLNLLLKKLGK